MIDFLMNNIIILNEVSCDFLLGSKNDPKSLYSLLQYVFTAIKISVPVLVIVLCSVDLVRAVAAQDEKDMKKVTGTCVKRIIAGIIIFFIPMLVNIFLELANFTGTCGIE